MPLHPQAQEFVDALAADPRPGWEEIGVDEGRRLFATFAPMFGEPHPIARVEDHTTSEGTRLRLYSSHHSAAPVAMFFHGGGWVLGNLQSHDALCRRLALHSDCTVIAVDYGLSPENAFPGPIEDCCRATEFVVENQSNLNVDASRLAVVGDSAGGHLATSVAIRLRDRSGPPIALQVLLYPVIEPNFDTESYQEFSSGFGLTRANMKWFWRQFLGGHAPASDAAPSCAVSLAELPPAVVVTAEYDVLRDEGNAYAEQLRRNGVEVDHRQYDGMLHAFIHFADVFETGLSAGQEIATEIGRRLRSDHHRSSQRL